MADKLFVIPVHGRMVRQPENRQVLPPTGAFVPDSSYWNRRIAEGDVVVAETPNPSPEKPPVVQTGKK